MSGRRRRRGHGEEHGPEEPDERWMASYMDMVTVLMCMFIVLFAMSTVDQAKFVQLKESLAKGFGQTKTVYADVAKGVVVPKKDVGKNGELSNSTQDRSAAAGNEEKAIKELKRLEQLRDAIEANLNAHGHGTAAQLGIDGRGLTVRLIGANTFFASNSAQLTAEAREIMAEIEAPLATVDFQISVEGNADWRAAAAPYATNWELSAARAVGVLRNLVEQGGIAPERVRATAYGSSRPLATGTSPNDLALNRRVDIVVLSDQPDAVRALIPGLLAQEGGTPAQDSTPAGGAASGG